MILLIRVNYSCLNLLKDKKQEAHKKSNPISKIIGVAIIIIDEFLSYYQIGTIIIFCSISSTSNFFSSIPQTNLHYHESYNRLLITLLFFSHGSAKDNTT